MAKYLVLLLVAITATNPLYQAQAASSLTLRQATQRVIDSYPTVRVSKLSLDKAAQELIRADSLLGWQLSSEVGASHDLGFTNAPVDSTTAGVGIQRQLKSGGTLSLQGGYAYDDNSLPLSPTYPNPLTRTSADIRYRKPLRQGAGNPLYNQSEVSARSGLEAARAGHQSLLTGVVQQTIDLYYGLAITQARKTNAENGVDRAQRLLDFVKANSRLGLTEKKDLLQAEAQLQAQRADLEGLRIAWEQQRTNLNRLMGRPWDEEFELVSVHNVAMEKQDLDGLIKEVEANSPDIKSLSAQLEISEAALKAGKDKYKSRLDLVLSGGIRTGSGPATPTAFNETDYAASVKLEYQRPLSRQGLKAELFQTQISHDIARRELDKTREDIKYRVQGLVAEITIAENALIAYKQRLATEQEKLAETKLRYRNGRSNTTELIQFENELNFAEFLVSQQTIELARKQYALKLLRGVLWNEFQLENTGLEVK